MSTVYLIRHGANDLIGRVIAGRQPGLHLNAEGREQAERVAERLSREPIAAIYTSPLERTQETAEPLARSLGLTPVVSEALHEIDFGEWTGKALSELDHDPRWKLYNSYRSGTRIPGGEMMVEVQARMVVELEQLRSRHPEEHVAVFGHGDPIKAAVAYYLGTPLDLFLRIDIDPAALTIVGLHEWGVKVLCLNEKGG